MAATRAQQIGIWAIAVLMAVGTVGSFMIIVLANSNDKTEKANIQDLTSKYQKDVTDQEKELSAKYYEKFSGFESRVAPFEAASATELQTEDLVVGDGEAITEKSSFTAYYIGWTPDGKIFDSSLAKGSLKAPLPVTPGGVIEGWSKGVDGMKIGGVREMTLPSALAYGENGSGELIPPNTPLKFIVMIIPTPETIQVPEALIKYYQSAGAQ